jgi:hypothetical protein
MGSTSFFQKKAEAYALRKGIRTAASSGKPDWDLVDEGLWLAAQQAEAAAASGELPGVTHILQVPRLRRALLLKRTHCKWIFGLA